MNSMPASSAICASATQSDQLPDQRSGTSVTARPDEQLAPNRPSFSLFALPIAARSRWLISGCKVTARLHVQPDRGSVRRPGWDELKILGQYVFEERLVLALRQRPQDRIAFVAGVPVLAAADPYGAGESIAEAGEELLGRRHGWLDR